MRVPTNASSCVPAYRSEPRRSSVASSWSRRPPADASTRIRAGLIDAARSRASSRSVASLSAGWRSIRVPEASATSTASGDAESKSPTATVTSRPSASACSRPLSAAMTGTPSGTAEIARGSGGPPPDTTTTNSSDTPSSAGITQIRFCGSAAPSVRPLSPAGPSSPLRPDHPSRPFAGQAQARTRACEWPRSQWTDGRADGRRDLAR